MRKWSAELWPSARRSELSSSDHEPEGKRVRAVDLDILIIEESTLPRYKRAARYLRALVGVFPAKDVVVWTPEEIKDWASVPYAFITTALREGRTLYGR